MTRKRDSDGVAKHYDVLIIGGGINGAGAAREASAAGYSVCVCDAGDFGGGTSSASTKLIHGGLRYLEHYEFRLVREALLEREVLWEMAPHIIKPMRFVLPHHSGLRPKWLLRLGLFLYDHIGGRKRLPPARSMDLASHEAGTPLKPEFKHAFEYSDCWVEDSRLVILNLRDAEAMGASVRPRTRVAKAAFEEGVWQIQLRPAGSDLEETVTASTIINATGPWVDEVLRRVFGLNDAQNVRLVKGSHIVVRKKFDHEMAYIFQNADDRIIFAIPYEDEFTLIGTTDVEQQSVNGGVSISPEEIDYLCRSASEYFDEPVERRDIVWTYSGVRPLFDDGASKAQEATRDYVVRREEAVGNGTLINIFGGKITTFRKLALQLVSELEKSLGERETHDPVPDHFCGGGFPIGEAHKIAAELGQQHPSADKGLLRRLVKLYGTEAETVLGSGPAPGDPGIHFGVDLFEAEVRYLMMHEWAATADDVMFRRTKLGIRMSDGQKRALEKWMADHPQTGG